MSYEQHTQYRSSVHAPGAMQFTGEPEAERKSLPEPRVLCFSKLKACCSALVLALVGLSGCTDDPASLAGVHLEIVATPNVPTDELLRPYALAPGPSGGLMVVEEGRWSLTALNADGRVLSRRALRPPELPEGVFAAASSEVGAALSRGPDGYWTLVRGLGPIFVPDAADAAPTLLGAGSLGSHASDGLAAAAADLSDTRGLLANESGELYLAVNDRLFAVTASGDLRLLAGGGDLAATESTAATEPIAATSLELELGHTVGLTARPDGTLYITDSRSARVWEITPEGQAKPIAGGGHTFGLPDGLEASDETFLELYIDRLAWDESRNVLWLHTAGNLFRLIPGESETGWLIGHEFSGVGSDMALIDVNGATALAFSDRKGRLFRWVDGVAQRLFTAREVEDDWLGRATAITPFVGEALLVEDATLRQLGALVPGAGYVRYFPSSAVDLSPAGSVISNAEGDIFFHNLRGLQYLNSEGLNQTVGTTRGALLLVGQTISEIRFSANGILRVGDDDALLLLDREHGLILRIDGTSGLTTRIVGMEGGGIAPRVGSPTDAAVTVLRDPITIAVAGPDHLIVADLARGDAVLYGINLGEDDWSVAGASVPTQRVTLLGGSASEGFAAAETLADLGLTDISAVAASGGSLLFAGTDLDGETATIWVEPDGALQVLPLTQVPTALLALDSTDAADADLVLYGSAALPEVRAYNRGATEATLLEHTLVPGEEVVLATIGTGPGQVGVVDLQLPVDPTSPQPIYVLDTTGRVHIFSQSGDLQSIGEAGPGAQSVAVRERATVVLSADGFWAAPIMSGAELWGVDLQEGGTRVLPTPSAVLTGSRVGNLDFDIIRGMAIDDESALWWVDGNGWLLRAVTTNVGRITPDSVVELVAETSPGAGEPVALQVVDGVLYLATATGVHSWDGSSWIQAVGGGVGEVAVGSQASNLALEGINGFAVGPTGMTIRARDVLVQISSNGDVVAAALLLGAEQSDGLVNLHRQSIALVGDDVFVTLAGGVYRVRGWRF